MYLSMPKEDRIKEEEAIKEAVEKLLTPNLYLVKDGQSGIGVHIIAKDMEGAIATYRKNNDRAPGLCTLLQENILLYIEG